MEDVGVTDEHMLIGDAKDLLPFSDRSKPAGDSRFSAPICKGEIDDIEEFDEYGEGAGEYNGDTSSGDVKRRVDEDGASFPPSIDIGMESLTGMLRLGGAHVDVAAAKGE